MTTAMKPLLSYAFIFAVACLLLSPVFGQNNFQRPLAGSQNSPQLTGTYIRIKHGQDANQSAQIDITQISRRRTHFHLTALWWPVGRSDLPHNGEIEVNVPLRNHIAVYTDGPYRLTLRFQRRSVVLTERGNNPDFGAYVSAAGTYRRVSKH